ncbi:GTP cyclohydrolase 1 type 2/Nif3 [Dichotomopilus funicola]|uniref:ATP phosphoribosyltransferase n=1 Tax=Dichotomopilus funicola TaxID=1934379 RepID=A0AAN6V2X2_9PEZI|nr:GTP cyclohydrolase 1 type 2/Nif3 [Dichotomopilus funicola]
MTTPTPTKYKLIFFVPPSALEACKTAIFAAGAGRYPGSGNYTEVCFTSFGTGQFRPGATANPHIGTPGTLEEVQEARVEILCVGEEVVRGAVGGLKRAHPYEEPAYEVYKLEDF